MKKCTMCKEVKPITEFNKNKSKKDGLNNICKVCSRARSKQYYKENHDKHISATNERNKRKRKEHRQKILELKSVGCSLCPEMEPCTLDFHHVNPDNKKYEPSRLIGDGYSWETIQSEIDKCILVCANCHRKIHAGIIEI